MPTELRIMINTYAKNAIRELERVERLLHRVRASGLDRPMVPTAVGPKAFVEVTQLQRQLEAMRTSQAGRPPPVNDAVSQKAFAEIAALQKQIDALRASAATTGAVVGGASSSMESGAKRVAAGTAAATAAMTSGAAKSTSAVRETGAALDDTGGIMGRFMQAQNSRLRAFGSEVQWTGRQMQHHLTMPFILMSAFSGATWFQQADIMTAVTKVYGDASQSASEIERELAALDRTATKLSETYGRNKEEVLQVAEAWAVAGSSGIALAESMHLTMQTSVLDSMDAVKASEMLIAIQAQYGVSTEGLTKIVAQLNYASNNTALKMGDLAAGFQRSASVARSSGMDAASLAGMIASIAPAAGSAEQAGNGLRMIMTRIQSQTSDTGRVIRYMNEQLGDQMISMKEFYGLPMEQKLFHLASGYDKLGSAQRTQAASMIAGAHQVGRMEILLRELNNQQGYYNKIIDDLKDDALVANVMFQELSKNLTSDPRKIQQAWQRFRNAMAQVFVPLIPIVTYFINVIGDLVKRFTDLDPALQKLIVGIGLVLALIGPLITAMGVVALTFVQIKPFIMAFGTMLYWLTAGPFVALFKSLRNLIVGLLATGPAFEQLSPKMQAVNTTVKSISGGIVTHVGGLISRLNKFGVNQDFLGLELASRGMSSLFGGMLTRFRTFWSTVTAESAANAIVRRAILVGEWAKDGIARQFAFARELVEENLQGKKLLALEAGHSQARLGLTIGETAKREAAASTYWGRASRIFRTGSDGITSMEFSFLRKRTAAQQAAASTRLAVEGTAQAAQLTAAKKVSTDLVLTEQASWARRNAAAFKGWLTRRSTEAAEGAKLVAADAARTGRLVGNETTLAAMRRAQAQAGSAQLLALEAGASSRRLALQAGTSGQMLALERGTYSASSKMAMSSWADKFRIFRTGSSGVTSAELAFGQRQLAITSGREKALAVITGQGMATREAMHRTSAGQRAATEAAAQQAQTALTAGATSTRLALEAGESATRLSITAGGASARVGAEAAGQAAETAVTQRGIMARIGLMMAGFAKGYALSAINITKQLAIAIIGQKKMWTLEARSQAMLLSIQKAGGVAQLASLKARQALFLMTSAAGWKMILATSFKYAAALGKGIFAALTGPVGLAVVAAIAIFMLFGDQIRDIVERVKSYFQNLPEGVKQGLQPIVNLWNNVVNGIASVWNRLPNVIKAPLQAVWNMIASAMNGIRKLLSFMNPFQRHSPSLVDNVNAGMDVIGKKFIGTSKTVQGSVNAMSAAVAGLRGSFAQLDAMNAAAQSAANVETIRTAGVGDVGAQIAAYKQVESQIVSLRSQLGPLNQSISQQEGVVNRAAAAVARADANIEAMNKSLDSMKAHADAVSASLDAARERLDRFASASIQGMGAVDDAMFKNEMAQKALQLQIAKLEEEAGVATGGASDHFARLQGDIENLSGQRMQLHFAGAGSDITDVYKGMEQQLKNEQLNIGGVGIDSGPGAEISKLQKSLEDLEKQATIMDLERSLKFDPLTRQIEGMTNAVEEMPFSTIVNGIRSSQAEVNSLEKTYAQATAAVQNQEAAIAQAEAARDILTARHSEQEEALQALRDTYTSVEEAIREGESALNDMTSAAETAIRRVEELARKQEEAANAANKAGRAGGAGGAGAGGAGAGGSTSPRFASFLEAEGVAEFGDPGEGFTVGRDLDLGTDQSALMDDFNPLEGMPELDELFGAFDMLSPFKNAWQKVVDWWNNTVFPMKNPLSDLFSGLGDAISGDEVSGALEPAIGVIERLKSAWDSIVDVWNNWVWPALVFGGNFIANTFSPIIDNLRNVFAIHLAPILQDVGQRFQELWPHIQELFKALWDIGKWILGFFIAKVLLKWIIIFTAVWAVITVGINMIIHGLGPVLRWLGDMIQAIILVVQGAIRIISGIINVIMGLARVIIGVFTLDTEMIKAGWDQIWQGLKDFVGGIIDIFKGLGLAIWSTLKNGFLLIWGLVWGFVEGVINFFVGLYQTIVGNSIIPDMVNAIVDWIAQLPGRVFAWILNLVVGVVQFFWDLYTGVIKWVADLVVGVVQFFWNLYVDVNKWVAELVLGVIKWFVDLVTTVVRNVSDFVASVINFYKDLFNKVVQIVLDLRDSVVEKAKELADNFVKNIISIKDKVLGFFRNAKDWLVDAGKNIVQGLIDGAGKLLSRLGEFFLDKVPGFIKEPFKNALGIESPSRVFMGYGENIVEGLIVGVEDKAGDLESSMQAMADVASAVEIAAPVMLAADTVDIPAMPAPAMVDAPAAIAAPAMEVPDFDAPDLDGLIASLQAFDVQYQLEVDQHAAGVEAEHAAMFANLDLQFQTWSANSLMAYAAYTLAVGTILSNFATAAIALYVNLYNTLAATTATGVNTITSTLSSGASSWLSLLTAFINALLVAWTNLINQLASLLSSGANNITNIWQGLANNFNSIFQSAIKPVFDAFLPMLTTLEGWFASTVDNIGSIWSQVQPKTADPARFVINEVYNEGLRSAWNSFNDFLDLPELPAYTARFRDGGSVDFRNGGKAIGAGTGTSDSIQARLSNGEHVITAREVVGAGGHHAIETQRAMWRRGAGAAKSYYDGPSLQPVGNVPAFRYGGAVIGGNFTANTPTNQWLASVVGQYFPGMTLTSGGPPGRSSADHHGGGLAIDFSNGTDTTPQMQAAARFFHQNYGRGLLELIHWPLNGWQNIKNGAPLNYGEPTNSQHRNHVHVAAPRPLGPPGSPIPPIMSGGGASAAIDWGAYIGETFDQAFEKIKDPGFGGGVGEWVPASMKKAELAKEFITKKVEEMGAFMGTINDADGLVERWRPMVKAALIRNGFDPSLRNQNLMLAQIQSESGGIPNRLQEVIDVNSGGNEAMGLLQIIPGTFATHRDPTLPNDRTDPWANMNAALRYYKARYGMDLGAMWGKGHGYDQGGLLPPTPGGFGTYYNHTGETEAVLTRPQWDNIYRAADSANRLSYEDIVRAFKGGLSSNEFESGLDKGIIRKTDPRWKELKLAVFDAAELVAVKSDESTETWVDEFQRIGGEAKDFFQKASEFYGTVTELTDFLSSDEFWDKVRENSGEAWGKAEEALDHFHQMFAGFSFVEERERLAEQVGEAATKAADATVDAIEDAEQSEEEREEARIKREEEAAKAQKTEAERAAARENSLFNVLSSLVDQRLQQVNESLARIGGADIFSIGDVFHREMGHLTNIANETFGSVENAGHLLGNIGEAAHKLVFENFNLTGAVESIRKSAGPDGQIPLILQGVFEALDQPQNREMIQQLEEYGRVVIQAIGQTLMELDFGKYYAPLINKLADWVESFPKYQARYAADTTTGFANSIDAILTRPLDTALNLLGGIYNLFTELAPSILRHAATIGGTLSSFANSGTGALAAIAVAVTTGNPMGLIPHIPQLLAVGLELIPQVIDAIINIVPLLIDGIINFFNNMMPWSNQGYSTAEEALKASIRLTKKLDDSDRFFNGGGGSYSGDDPRTWRPEGASGNQNNFYGDLSFPNVTNEDDAKGFIENLSRL